MATALSALDDRVADFRRSLALGDLNSLKMLNIENIESVINMKVFGSATALIYSVKQDNLEIVKWLLKVQGINVNSVDSKGRSALHWAVEAGLSGNEEAVKLLLKQPEIQVDMRDNYGNTAEDLAVEADSEIAIIIKDEIIAKLKKTLEETKKEEKVNVEDTVREMPRFGKRKLESTLEIFQYKKRGHMKEVEKIDKAIDGVKECLKGKDSDETLQEAKKDFECPICFEDMEPPKEIWQCEGGHVLCENCKATIKNCPTCKKAIGSRNRAMEDLYLALF